MGWIVASMTTGTMSTAQLAAATPDSRDRFVDLLRVVSLATVVLGHWFMAVVLLKPDGGVEVDNLLAVAPALQPLTWVLQVMPVFFLVGGFSHALSYRSVRRRAATHAAERAPEGDAELGTGTGGSIYPAFLRARLQRLLRPTAVAVGVWALGALLIELVGADGALTAVAARQVTQPLWFIGIYLAMVAFTPPLLRLHERWGWGAFGALVAAATTVDVLRFAFGVPYVEFLNFAFVWLAVHQLGFLRADGALRLPRVPLTMALGGLVSALLLVGFGPYPVSMVGMPGEEVSNMAPPTVALLCHGIWLAGAVELLRHPAGRLLARPSVWRGVVAANGVAMTAFLWHLTAMLGVYGTLIALDVSLPEPASAAWWAQLPLRVSVAMVLTALLVAVFRRFELPPPARPFTSRTVRAAGPLAAVGAALALLGVLGLSMVGLGELLDGRTATLVAVEISAPAAITMVLVGWLLVEWAGRDRRANASN